PSGIALVEYDPGASVELDCAPVGKRNGLRLACRGFDGIARIPACNHLHRQDTGRHYGRCKRAPAPAVPANTVACDTVARNILVIAEFGGASEFVAGWENGFLEYGQ